MSKSRGEQKENEGICGNETHERTKTQIRHNLLKKRKRKKETMARGKRNNDIRQSMENKCRPIPLSFEASPN
jgi:hypothetical protein